MADSTARFALPFILPGQAQKELYHNEALTRLDAALHACVETTPAPDPPGTPVPGQCWLVGGGATAAWAGEDGKLASWTDGGWRFVTPAPGMTCWNRAAGCWLYWSGTAWSDGSLPASALMIAGQQVVGPRLPTVSSPSGGTTIDSEARATLDALIATLKSHGLIDP